MWWFRLAVLWSCTVDEAMRRCSEKEFALWRAYYQIEPWGEERADLRAGIIASVIAAAHGVKKAKPADYMPRFDATEPKAQTAKEMANVFNSFRPPAKK